MLGVVVLLKQWYLAIRPWLGVGRTRALWLSRGSGASCVGTWEPFFWAHGSGASPQLCCGFLCTWWLQTHSRHHMWDIFEEHDDSGTLRALSPLHWNGAERDAVAVKAGPLLYKKLQVFALCRSLLPPMWALCSRAAAYSCVGTLQLLKASFTACATLTGSSLWSTRPQGTQEPHPNCHFKKTCHLERGSWPSHKHRYEIDRIPTTQPVKDERPPVISLREMTFGKITKSGVLKFSHQVGYLSVLFLWHRTEATYQWNMLMENVACLHPKV